MNGRKLTIGISPCPNDTFTFHGLLTGAVKPEGFDLEIVLYDIEELNRRYAAGEFHASKVSFVAALEFAEDSVVLRAGSALGFGVGPLLLSRPGAPPLDRARVLCPGARTTAHFLLCSFHPEVTRVEQTVFSAIMPELERGTADYGVCIHEGRFTYAELGLVLVEDLGTTWEEAEELPLPLGGIVARQALGAEVLRELDAAIVRSLDHALAHPEEALVTMRRHARELDDDVIRAHVDLYVNEWTRDLGVLGALALYTLDLRARAEGFVVPDTPPLSLRQ